MEGKSGTIAAIAICERDFCNYGGIYEKNALNSGQAGKIAFGLRPVCLAAGVHVSYAGLHNLQKIPVGSILLLFMQDQGSMCGRRMQKAG